MYSKKCWACNKTSYSATDKGRWICPYCGKDLTFQPVTETKIYRRKCRNITE
ncbi:hypothetical protein V6C27_02105 [Peptococcaceae bacterium 1198_IL3148]